jgi:hypothetical protein
MPRAQPAVATDVVHPVGRVLGDILGVEVGSVSATLSPAHKRLRRAIEGVQR